MATRRSAQILPLSKTADGRLLTVEETATRLGTPVRFVRRLVQERRIPFHKVGRYVRIAESDLEDFVASGRVERPVEAGAARSASASGGRRQPRW